MARCSTASTIGQDSRQTETGAIKLLFVLLNVLVAVLTPLDLTNPGAPTWPRSGVMVAAFMGLGIWPVVYLRLSRPSLLLDLVPLALLFVGEVAAGEREWVFARMYVAVFLQAVYRPTGVVCGSWPRVTS